MRILFFISIAAVLALVWAAVSIAQHVRQARRKRALATRAAFATARSKTETAEPVREVRTASAQRVTRGTVYWEQSETTPPPPPAPLPRSTARDWAQLRNNAFMGTSGLPSTALSDNGSRNARPS